MIIIRTATNRRRIAVAIFSMFLISGAPLPDAEKATSDSPAISQSERVIDDLKAKKFKYEEQTLHAQQDAAQAAGRQVNITAVQTLITLVGTIMLIWTLWETRRMAKSAITSVVEARRMADAAVASLSADTKPFLIVRPADGEFVRWTGEGLEPKRIFFQIENAGRAVAIVTGIYRSWSICNPSENPQPLHYPTASRAYWYQKSTSMPIGPLCISDNLDSFSERIDFAAMTDKSWIYFQGYIEFLDIIGRKYVLGFLHVYKIGDERGLHIALPRINPEKFNYHREVDSRS